MTTGAAELPVEVDVPPSWTWRVDGAAGDAARQEVAAALDGVLAAFGLPLRAAVQWRPPVHGPAVFAALPTPTLFLDGAAVRCAPERMAAVLACCRGEAFAPLHLEAASAGAAGPAELAALCAELAQQRPERLLTAPAVGVLAGALRALGATIADADLADLAALLRLRLAQRIGLADLATIAARWEAGRAAHEPAAAVAEALVAAGPPVRIVAARPTLRMWATAAPVDTTAAARARERAYYDLGVRFPDWHLVADDTLPPDAFRIDVGAQRGLVQRGLTAGQWLADEAPGGDGASARLHPASLRPLHLHADASGAVPADDAIGPLGWAIVHAEATLRPLAACFVTRSVVEATTGHRQFIEPALLRLFLSLHPFEALLRVLRRLVAEQVSVRNLRGIIERMCDFDHVVADSSTLIVFDDRLPLHQPPPEAWRPSEAAHAAFVRCGLARQLAAAARGGAVEIDVLLLEPRAEQMLAAQGLEPVSAPDEHEARALLAGLDAACAWAPDRRAPVILTTVEARTALRALLAEAWPAATVLGYQELPADCALRPQGRFGFVGI